MIYKPNYCNNCGESIERFEWKLWTSTRFCENCENDFKLQDWLPRGIIGTGVLAVIFSFGVYLKQPEKNAQLLVSQPQINSTNNLKETSNKQETAKVLTNTEVAKNETVGLETKQQVLAKNKPEAPTPINQKTVQSVQLQTLQNEPKEIVYFCGAKTKKGTPCSRKVKGKERCWQHLGEEALLSQEKLKAIE
ncbi:MAG: hypothetical protein MUC29_00845 [Pyrinomonadaceae bacterium]|jgi:hypothetical protein|nr:hypothetical protein [Pyrinomonadaceae bacterium]